MQGTKKIQILVFGNLFVKEDSIPLQILPELQNRFSDVDFVVADPTEILKINEKKVWIIDTVKGLEEVTLITDLEKFEKHKALSVHDYDLFFDLKLLKKLKKLKSIKIIGIPMGSGEKKALEDVSDILISNGFSKNE